MSEFDGAVIKTIRPLTEAERRREGWVGRGHGGTPVIELEDGRTLYPSRDPEGNGPGALFGTDEDGKLIGVHCSED